MQNNNLNLSAVQQRRLFGALKRSSKRRMQRRLVSVICAALLLLLVLLLTACAHQLPQPCPQQQTTMQPALSEPIPSVSYLGQWRLLAEEWRKKLTFTHQTLKP